MKLLKTILVTLIILMGINQVNAQTDDIISVWNVKLTDNDGDTGMAALDFTTDGKLIMRGKEYGTWSCNNAEKTVTIASEFKNINGKNQVEKLDDEQMVLINTESQKQVFKRMNLPNGQEYNNEITGTYILKKVFVNGTLDNERLNIVVFKNNGLVLIEDAVVMASWKYNKIENELTLLNAPEELSGLYKISNQEKELSLTGDTFKLVFDRLNIEEINKKNIASNLVGLWKLELKDIHRSGEGKETHYLALENPNSFGFGTTKDEYSSNGMWIKDDETISFIGGHFNFSGKNEIIEIVANKMIFKNKKGETFTAIKVEQDIDNLEQLNYNKADYFDIANNNTSKLKIDKTQTPWNNAKSNIDYLKNISNLQYKKYKYNEKYHVVGIEEKSVSFQNLGIMAMISQYIFKEQYQGVIYSEDLNHPFILFKEMLSGKVTAQETITTPAGTFKCTVVEGYTDFETEVKLWMINDKPGVYAKMIVSENDESNELIYATYILDEIIK